MILLSFVDAVTPSLLEWAKAAYIEGIIHIFLLLFLIFKVIPWIGKVWEKISGS